MDTITESGFIRRGGAVKPRVLITGGAGYIGDCIADFLVEDANVTVVDSLMFEDHYMRPNVEFVRMDIRSDEFVDFVKRGRFDAVVHMAAIVGDGACAVDERLTRETNVDAVERLVGTLPKSTRLIFASTCSVYGASDDMLTEESPTNPLSLYASTKLEAEEIVKNSGLNYTIFRLGTIFGMSSPFARIRADLVVNILSYRACCGMDYSVYGGEQWRPLVSVTDVARNFANAVFRRDIVGTYILSHKNYTILDVGREVERCIATDAKLDIRDMPFEDMRNYRVDNTKATNAGLHCRGWLQAGIMDIQAVFNDGRIPNPWALKYHNAKFMVDRAKKNG